MKTEKITVNGKEYKLHEMTLGNFPECAEAVSKLSSKDKKEMRDALFLILELCSNAPKDELANAPLREMGELVTAIIKVNGIASAKKAETPEE